ncbi:unnamed protein product [Adineta ricciae]|uniref:Uncharacterized protein n=1 Tax=Adineta ricciae TaxID=249248 RepID=A0A814JQQ4_ADIRI|nr:unnamed protein product [Adineta ricciae]
MASRTTTYERDSSDTDESTDTKRSKQTQVTMVKPLTTVNLMQFVEISPCDPKTQPHPRSGHRAVATYSDLWIWGGYFPSRDPERPPMFAELWRFNYALRQWTLESTTGNAPDSTLASHSMCVHHNYVFVFGGTGYPFGRNVSNDLFMLDLKRLQWKKLQLQNQQPNPVYGASLIGKGDYLYVLCGTDSWRYYSDVYEIHLPTLCCTQIGHTFDETEDTTGNGRYRQEAYIYADQIFLFGGGSNSGVAFAFELLPVFDLNERRWSFVRTNPDPIHNFPTARKFHSIFPLGEHQILMFGGANFDQTAGIHVVAEAYVWIFDLEKLEWSRSSSSMIQPTYFHAAAMNRRGEIWSHGGVIQSSTSDLPDTRITSIYKMHTKVPDLREVCWDRFLNCLADRNVLISQAHLLTQLNIPGQYLERIH